jgi:signal transduction histidine kinase
VAPLLAPGRVLGGIVLAFTHSGRQYGADDMVFADELARRAALGLENARLFAEAQALNAELETRVKLRTAELVRANTSLEAEVGDRKRVESELAASREQLRGLTARLQAAREEESARISREVHDELGGALTGLKMDVAAIRRNLGESEAQRLARLEALSAQIDGTVQMVRRIATDLRPALLDDFGLAAALEWQLSELKERAGIDGRFVTNVDHFAWNAEGSIALFRIFQEALTNVARHAQASKVEVRLTREADELELMVQDNGRGIRPVDQAGAKSLGLAGIRERVRLLEGQCQITGAPGEGTTVLIRLPLWRVSTGEAPPGNLNAGAVQLSV